MKDEIIIKKMIQHIEKIAKYTLDIEYDEFIANEMIVEACVFNLSQLGELSNKLTSDYRTNNRDIPWGQIYGLRNRIVHDYEGVNRKLVWEIIREDLPDLKRMLGNQTF